VKANVAAGSGRPSIVLGDPMDQAHFAGRSDPLWHGGVYAIRRILGQRPLPMQTFEPKLVSALTIIGRVIPSRPKL
jgi:hypothetical protein